MGAPYSTVGSFFLFHETIFPPPFAGSTPSVAAADVSHTVPGVAVVVVILTSVFSITFLLLLYAKHCKRSAAESSGPYGSDSMFRSSGGTAGERRNSGVDRAMVESLPVFWFGALRGQKAGLECVVCLGKFEPTEALRLLPKCRHGFHPEPPKPSTTGPPNPPETKLAVAAAAAAALRPAPPPRLRSPLPFPISLRRHLPHPRLLPWRRGEFPSLPESTLPR
ncbi:hypothetical protein E2562_028557 [Oryza meyeriana var. granulata]|uniref:RING-type domain-containing protein n=1 Tax=Oryza meyeriana var. granulata TaxID=110450 RepID=A0A6G1EQW0_9ORYZ|nr:hypothetical protein E2562_028557 [Oryza meyeriana var. granulata]